MLLICGCGQTWERRDPQGKPTYFYQNQVALSPRSFPQTPSGMPSMSRESTAGLRRLSVTGGLLSRVADASIIRSTRCGRVLCTHLVSSGTRWPLQNHTKNEKTPMRVCVTEEGGGRCGWGQNFGAVPHYIFSGCSPSTDVCLSQ